jgi:hypothetical protein
MENKGKFNPDSILGRDTFRSVSEVSGIPMAEFLKHFGITEEEFEKPIKDVAQKEGSKFDTEDVREFVSEKMKR